MASPFVLIVALLTVESSYVQNIERPRGTVPDTVQFWFSPTETQRIKTFAVDHDIHTHRISTGKQGQRLTQEGALENTRKNYGDVIETIHVLEFKDPADTKEVAAVLKKHGLLGRLEIGRSGLAFYNPDRARYWSQSKPQ